MCTIPDTEQPTYTAKAHFRKGNEPEEMVQVFNVVATNCECGNPIVRLPNNNVWVETE
jgi:hypothetical protein